MVDHPLNRLDGVWWLMMVEGWTAKYYADGEFGDQVFGRGCWVGGGGGCCCAECVGVVAGGEVYFMNEDLDFVKSGIICIPLEFTNQTFL